jgi:myo-inositol-1(or 4)-monophosphatase
VWCEKRLLHPEKARMARTALLNVMVQAVLKAGKGLARDFGEVENLQVSLKGPGDFVSAADHRADKTLIAELGKARPTYGFLTEENGAIAGSDTSHRWIIDPLDGTTNFLHGIPLFAISLGLERDGQVIAGVIYNPVLNELYVAEKGGGAFLNDRRLRVAGRRNLGDCVIATGLPSISKGGHDAALAGIRPLMDKVAGLRRSGSAATDLAWVASGRFDGYWDSHLSPWDLAAGIILVREAGGLVSDASGRNEMFSTGTIVAGNEPVHAALIANLAETRAAALP